MTPAILAFHQVKKEFAGRFALGGLSFQLPGPGVVGLVGPNGAGKTTTLRIAAGFFPPSEGRVSVRGASFEKDELELKSKIGYLPERPPLYPDMTVEEYLLLVARLKRARPRTRLLEDCGLSGVASRRIGALSAGYRQRVGLAAALVPDPWLLLLDEPTAHLDPLQREEALALVRREGKERAVLFSSHLLSEVEDACERVLVLQQGKLLADSTPTELRSRGGVLRLRVKGPADAVMTVLAALPGVTSGRLSGRQGDEVTVELSGTPDTAQAALVVVSAGWGLLELSPGRGGIEALLRGPDATSPLPSPGSSS